MLPSTTGAIPEIIGYTRRGTPVFAIAGADDGAGGGDGGDGGDGKNDDDKGGKPTGGDGSDDLGDAGKRALAAERDARKAAEKRAADAEAKVKEHEDAKKSDVDKLSDKLAESERERIKASQQLTEVRTDRAIERAAAKAGFIDPEDAVLSISRASLKLDDDGVPSKDSLEKALKDLAESKPHLVRGKGNGSWDGGARGKPAGSKTDMNTLIREAAGH